MIFRTKMHLVDAISAERVIDTAFRRFKTHPKWIQETIDRNNLFIGGSVVIVFESGQWQVGNKDDVLILKPDQKLSLMSKKDFFDRYEDMWDKNNNSIV